MIILENEAISCQLGMVRETISLGLTKLHRGEIDGGINEIVMANRMLSFIEDVMEDALPEMTTEEGD